MSSGSSLPLLGIPDELFVLPDPARSLITKREVRVVALAALGLQPTSIVWDIGTGSGSVAIEAARLASSGHVYAIEKTPRAVAAARANQARFGVTNLTIVEGVAPGGLVGFLDPDAVFIGGSGTFLGPILETVCGRLSRGGRIVVSLATIEHLAEAVQRLKAARLTPQVTCLQVSRSTAIQDLTRFEALNPVFLVQATRGE